MKNAILEKVDKYFNFQEIKDQPFIFLEFYSTGKSKNFIVTYGKIPYHPVITIQENSISLRSDTKPVCFSVKYGTNYVEGPKIDETTNSINFHIDHYQEFPEENIVEYMIDDNKFCKLITGSAEVKRFTNLFLTKSKEIVTHSENINLRNKWKILSKAHELIAPKLGFLYYYFHDTPEEIVYL